jgi:hypothetical protein
MKKRDVETDVRPDSGSDEDGSKKDNREIHEEVRQSCLLPFT